MESNDEKLFYAKATKGFIPKTIFDTLATSMNRITLKLKKTGIYIRQPDCEDIRWSHVLWDIEWPRKKFEHYTCSKEFCIMINAKNLQKMLRTVKKKDSLTFFMSKNDETQLGLIIQPSGSAAEGSAARAEIVYLSVQHVDDITHGLPDMYETDTGKMARAYGQPVVIGAADFQKIKKMAGTVTELTVKIQRPAYIAFLSGDNKIMRSELTFGKLSSTPEDDYSSSGEDDDKNTYPCIYEKNFMMSLFVPLVKLPGMTTRMEFYAPKIEQFPLKISMSASSGLGDITVFVKDQKQIAVDDNQKIQESSLSAVQTKGKKSGRTIK